MNVTAATPESVLAAARYLAQGGLVAFPTETVYGLGADATNGLAVAGIFSAKRRPTFNPLIIHLPSAELAWRYGVPDDFARKLADAFWPGPMTLVLPLRPNCDIDSLALAGLSTIAIRVPAHPVALSLLKQAGRPIAAPSANRSGRISPTSAGHVASDFGADIPIILDGGSTQVGLESTIVDLTGALPVLLRPGGISRGAIERVLGVALGNPVNGDPDKPSSPGQLRSHYAPEASVRLDVTEVRAGEALLAFGNPIEHAGPMRNLSPTCDLLEAAANLFAWLRELDATGATNIAVMPIPAAGLGEAINDRLRRAAAPR